MHDVPDLVHVSFLLFRSPRLLPHVGDEKRLKVRLLLAQVLAGLGGNEVKLPALLVVDEPGPFGISHVCSLILE